MRTREPGTGHLLLIATLVVGAWSCTLYSSQDSDGGGGGAATGGTGPTTGSGGSTSTGGVTGSGGSGTSTGGTGQPGSGGAPATGGITGTAGSLGRAGASGTGGFPGTGGSPSTGGATGGGGTKATGGTSGGAGATGTGGAAAVQGPCDIYAADGGPCVAAHSTVRALYGAYKGNLYQVKRTSDNATKDIPVLSAGGFADSSVQDAFCTSSCTISIIYDQSGMGNHLTKAPGGGAKTTGDNEVSATALPVTISGHKVYGIHITSGYGYRNNSAKGTATGDNPETEYMITSGNFYNNQCCFDYGNMETTSRDDGEGTMEAIYFGNCTFWGKGGSSGPWVMGDLENGLWAGNTSPFTGNTPVTSPYVTAMLKGDAAGKNHWAIKAGNGASGSLMKMFDGQRPSSRYNPMRKEGAIGLGTGGDNSNSAQGNFFEGIMTSKFSSDAADDMVQANIVSAYGN